VALTPQLLRREDAVLVVVDVQEAFRSRISGWDAMVGACRALVDAAELLAIPTIYTEQYPQRLGQTIAELARRGEGTLTLPKLEFSSARAAGFDDHLRRLGRDQVIVCGIEAHICVHQTIVDLVRRGNAVHAALDAISAQSPENRAIAAQRAAQDGAYASSAEMAIFELAGSADTEHFRALQQIVKASR